MVVFRGIRTIRVGFMMKEVNVIRGSVAMRAFSLFDQGYLRGNFVVAVAGRLIVSDRSHVTLVDACTCFQFVSRPFVSAPSVRPRRGHTTKQVIHFQFSIRHRAIGRDVKLRSWENTAEPSVRQVLFKGEYDRDLCITWHFLPFVRVNRRAIVRLRVGVRVPSVPGRQAIMLNLYSVMFTRSKLV